MSATQYCLNPDQSQILPSSATEALLASIKNRYNELATAANVTARPLLETPGQSRSTTSDFLPQISDQDLMEAIKQSPLSQESTQRSTLAIEGLPTLRHPPRSIHIFSLLRLHLSILICEEASKAIRFISPMLSESTKRTDIRLLDGKDIEVCAKRIPMSPPLPNALLAKNLFKLLTCISISGAYFDALGIPRPDNMGNYVLERDKTSRNRRYTDWKKLLVAHHS